jgi:hypothetical protein
MCSRRNEYGGGINRHRFAVLDSISNRSKGERGSLGPRFSVGSAVGEDAGERRHLGQPTPSASRSISIFSIATTFDARLSGVFPSVDATNRCAAPH